MLKRNTENLEQITSNKIEVKSKIGHVLSEEKVVCINWLLREL